MVLEQGHWLRTNRGQAHLRLKGPEFSFGQFNGLNALPGLLGNPGYQERKTGWGPRLIHLEDFSIGPPIPIRVNFFLISHFFPLWNSVGFSRVFHFGGTAKNTAFGIFPFLFLTTWDFGWLALGIWEKGFRKL